MKLSQLIRDFRIRNDDLTKPYQWSFDQLAKWFSEAELEASIRSKLIFDKKPFAIQVGSTEIKLPVGLFEFGYIELSGAGKESELHLATRKQLDIDCPGWRTRKSRPGFAVHEGDKLYLGSISDAEYTGTMEFYRTPNDALSDNDQEPEIPEINHEGLIDWVERCAYLVPDADYMDKERADKAEKRFIDLFGERPSIKTIRQRSANRPHRNRTHL